MEWLSGSSSSAAVDAAASQENHVRRDESYDLPDDEYPMLPRQDPLTRIERKLQETVDEGTPVSGLEIETVLVLVGLDVDAKGISWRGICARERIRSLGDLDETLMSGEFEGLFPEAVAKRLRLARFLVDIAIEAREPKLATVAAATGAASTDDLVSKLDVLPVMYRARIRNKLRNELSDQERSAVDFATRLADDVRLGFRFFVCGGAPAPSRADAPVEEVSLVPDPPMAPETPRKFAFDAVRRPSLAEPPVDDSPDASPDREWRPSSAGAPPHLA